MKIPLSWLKDYVEITEDIDELCAKMVKIGLEIEEVKYLGQNVTNVKVCQIKQIQQHPNADNLLCCKVDVGDETIPIVTNDHHVRVGDKVPVALNNSVLANGLHIKKGKMRGEESWGMFCGAEELGIDSDYYPDADAEGVLVLKTTANVGEDIRKEIGLDDYVLDISVTSNRQDCNSVLGLAREVAVALGKSCKEPCVDYTENSVATDKLVNVIVEAKELCPSYFMQGLTDVKVEKSPTWMTSRLAKVGLRGINNLVDITNYVLYEIGQPMHAFDYNDITDKTIVVRRAENGEIIVPFDGKEYKLDNNDLVIADKKRAVGLAGIMGGLNSGIKNGTDCVLFESATFARGSVRKTSRKLGLRSDSSARFEKGIEPYTNNLGLSRALHLCEELNCGKITTGRIAVGKTAEERVVIFDRSRIAQLLGISIPDNSIAAILKSLNISVAINGSEITCKVPAYRDDISRDCDIIEELIRVYGYDNINGTFMENTKITRGGKTDISKFEDDVRRILTGLRYNECIFYPFSGKALNEKASVDPIDEKNYIRVINPIGEELSMMNVSLAPNMLQCAAVNISRGNACVCLFEIGKAYLSESVPLTELPKEEKRLSLCATDVSFESFRDDVLQLAHSFIEGKITLERSANRVLHPGVSADMFVSGEIVGSFGKINPLIAEKFDIDRECAYAEIYLDKLFGLKKVETKYRPIPKYPSVTRDFAFVCDESVFAQNILDEFASMPLVEEATLFDVYRGEQIGAGKKSLAVSVVFRDNSKTLHDADVDKQSAKALKNIRDKFGAVLR